MTSDIEIQKSDITRGMSSAFQSAVMKQIQKDFVLVGAPLPADMVVDRMSFEWLLEFEKFLQLINNEQNSKLIQLMYRIDIDEKLLFDVDIENNGYHQLALIIVKREENKVSYRLSQQ